LAIEVKDETRWLDVPGSRPLLRCGVSRGWQTIRVVIIDGQSAGTYHNWRLTTPVLKKELEETGLFEVSVLAAPPSDGDFSNFKPELSRYRVIVMNYDGPTWPAELRAQFEQYVAAGGGLVMCTPPTMPFRIGPLTTK